MIGATATGTKTITSIDVHTEEEPERILLGAHLPVPGGSPGPMTVTIPAYAGVPATGALALTVDAASAAATTRLPGLAGATLARPASTFPSGRDDLLLLRWRKASLSETSTPTGRASRCALAATPPPPAGRMRSVPVVR
jgi:hypothetical protein